MFVSAVVNRGAKSARIKDGQLFRLSLFLCSEWPMAKQRKWEAMPFLVSPETCIVA
jgi:hypothetical protein